MERITQMHVAIAIVTMVTVNIGRETNMPLFDAWIWESEVNLALMGLRLRKYILYRVKGELSRHCDCTPQAKSDIYNCLVCVRLDHLISLLFLFVELGFIFFCTKPDWLGRTSLK